MKPLQLYLKLFSEYGPQYWWPVTDKGSSVPTYKPRKRLSESQKLEVCIGAILTQNTSWENVMKAIVNLNRAELVSVKGIIGVSEKKLARLIKPSGYFNVKAKKLKVFALHVEKKYNGNLKKMFSRRVSELREELLSIWGIGEETADSILCYAAGKPVFMVDAYTKRIAERFYGKKFSSYRELQEFFVSQMNEDSALFSEFHALLVEHGKRYCTKSSPKCRECPLAEGCAFAPK